MIPLLPFLAGIVVGAAAVSALRSERTRKALNQTSAHLRTTVSEVENGVRAAAQSGLTLLRGAFAKPPAKTKPAPKRRTKQPSAAKVAKPAATKRASRKPEKRKAPGVAA